MTTATTIRSAPGMRARSELAVMMTAKTSISTVAPADSRNTRSAMSFYFIMLKTTEFEQLN